MAFKKIQWRLAFWYIVLLIIIMLGLVFYLSGAVRRAYVANLEQRLQADARMLGSILRPQLTVERPVEALAPLVAEYAQILEARITVIAPDGEVWADSMEDPARMENHLYRLEVQQALNRGVGSDTRESRTLGYDTVYVAVPVVAEGQILAIMRIAMSVADVNVHLSRMRRAFTGATAIVSVLALLLALYLARHITRPVAQLTAAAARIAAGDLRARVIPTTRDEIGTLTRVFNQTTEHLQEAMASLEKERRQLASILDHMADGVLITDEKGLVRLINPAACRILGAIAKDSLGRPFGQVARHHQLISLWRQCWDSRQEAIEVMELARQGPFVQAIITPLPSGTAEGSLLILQDLSSVRRLQTVRRDLISNISHELRTPLASLKALVDTLRDGAMDDPPAAQHFLDLIDTEVDAMSQMVQELLELARIESGRVPIRLAPMPVGEAILPGVERLRPQAERAGLALKIDIPQDLPAVLVDAERVQQVMTNLVHNAVKFTSPGGEICVAARKLGADERHGLSLDEAALSDALGNAQAADDWVLVSVQDTGVGIAPDVLPRIFERFFKADQSRSGGGTGLGLAIAKHIVQAHGGQIWAESIEGQGSAFYFTLLAAPRDERELA